MKELKLSKEERMKRIIAKGKHSNHSHVLLGDITFLEKCFEVNESKDYGKAEIRYKQYLDDENTLRGNYCLQVDNPQYDIDKPLFYAQRNKLQEEYNKDIESMDVATTRHLLETEWVNNSIATWTKEHIHIPIKTGTYKYIPQIETNPLNGLIRKIVD